jgi:zinc ribbon protein
MFCPSCGSENPDTAQFCTQCARAIHVRPMAQTGAGASPMPPPQVTSAPPPPMPSMTGSAPAHATEPLTAYPPLAPLEPEPEKTMSIFGRIGIVLVSMLAVAFAFGAPVPPLPNESQAVGYRFGRLLAAILIPLLVAYIAAGRKKARNPNLFAGLFCGIGIFLLLANGANSFNGNWGTETTEQKLSRLVREAAGLQPVRTPLFGEAKADTKLRNFFKEIFGINKEYQQAVDKIDMRSTDKLVSPESFADPGSVADGLRQLHAAYALDEIQEQRMQQVLESLRHSFDDLSPSDREDMLKGFNEALAKGMPTRKRAITTEKAWIDAMDDVYDYAQAHHADFHMSNGRLTVAHDDVMEQFNTRIRTLNARREEFIQAKNDFEKMQAQNMQKMGLTREQTGLH